LRDALETPDDGALKHALERRPFLSLSANRGYDKLGEHDIAH
jgi:hypothetical protein